MRTGLWLSELTHFWNVIEQGGLQWIYLVWQVAIHIDPKRLAHEILAERALN